MKSEEMSMRLYWSEFTLIYIKSFDISLGMNSSIYLFPLLICIRLFWCKSKPMTNTKDICTPTGSSLKQLPMISRLCSIYSSVTGSLSFIWVAKLTAAKLHTNFNQFPTQQCLFTHRQCLIRETRTLERWMIWTSGSAYSLTECHGNFGGKTERNITDKQW